MQTPPPYAPPAPKKTNVALIVGIILGGLALCCGGVIAMMFMAGSAGLRQGMPMIECSIGFKGVRDGMLAYAKENGGKLPPAENWEEAIRPYYQKELEKLTELKDSPFKITPMPAEGPWGCRAQNDTTTGMAYNSDVAGKAVADLPDKTVVLFEVPASGRNLAQPYKPLDESNSPTIFGEKRGWMTISIQGDVDTPMDEEAAPDNTSE